MPPDTLEFEEPIAVLLKEVEALSMLPRTPERQRSIEGLHRQLLAQSASLAQRLTPGVTAASEAADRVVVRLNREIDEEGKKK